MNESYQYQDNKAAAAALLWNQCSNIMKAKIQSRKDYDTELKDNPIKLLQAIKQHAMSFESTQYRMKTICDAMKTVLNSRQRDDEHGIDYLKRFKASKDVFYSHVGKTFAFPSVLVDDKEYNEAMAKLHSHIALDKEKEEAQKTIEKVCKKHTDQFFAYLYLENADRSKYGSLISGLETQWSLGNKQYPQTMIEANNVLDNHTFDKAYGEKKKKRKEQNKKNKENDKSEEDKPITNLSFAQMKNTCYCCGKNHKLPDCPEKDRIPRSDWYINKTKEMKNFQQMAKVTKEIEGHLNTNSSTSSTIPSTEERLQQRFICEELDSFSIQSFPK